MSTATDHFTSFVDALADLLDDENADATARDDGEAIARRLYLSRFHLDRIVSSVAGEPPARFRRRILLERAAYRLLTTRMTVLDVAVEAGYGSHEAFTRAFTGPTESARGSGGHDPPRSGSRRPATSTSTRPGACGCRPTRR